MKTSKWLHRPVLASTAAAIAIAAVAVGEVRSKPKGKPTACPGGRFVRGDALQPLVPGGTTTPDVLTIANGTVAIASGCDVTAAKLRAKRKSTTLAARWTACGSASRVRLRAAIAAPACDQLQGTLKVKGAAATVFTAALEPGPVSTTTTTLPPGSTTGIDAIYALRDDVLQTNPRGQHYTALFETYRTEVVAWLMHETGLLDFAKPAFQTWLPHFEALVNGRGAAATITTDQIAALEEFFARLSVPASPNLQSAIATELAAMAPLSRFVGMTMNQALAAVFAVPVPTTATVDGGGRGRGLPGCAAQCILGPVCTY
jgi:hypothetical protein